MVKASSQELQLLVPSVVLVATKYEASMSRKGSHEEAGVEQNNCSLFPFRLNFVNSHMMVG